MASYHIATTKIGTGDTANIADEKAITLYKDFHFPKGWAKALDFDILDLNKDVNISILHGRVSAAAQLGLGFGLAGPNWAGTMDVQGDVNDGTMLLDVTNDQFVSGMLVGADASFTMSLSFQFQRETFEFDWRHPFSSHWTYAWHELLRIDLDPQQFDLLMFIVNINKLGVEIAMKIMSLFPGLGDIISLFPDITLPEPLTFNHGIVSQVSSSPLFTGGLDFPTSIEAQIPLLEIVEAIGKTGIAVVQPELAPAIEVETKLEKLAKWVKPTVSTGPIFGINFTTYLRISGITAYWGEDEYQATDVGSLGSEIEATLPDDAPADTPPDQLGIEFDHRPAIDLTLGWYVCLSWLKIFSVQPEAREHPSDLSPAFTIPAGLAYTHEIRNDVGSKSTNGVVVTLIGDGWVIGG